MNERNAFCYNKESYVHESLRIAGWPAAYSKHLKRIFNYSIAVQNENLSRLFRFDSSNLFIKYIAFVFHQLIYHNNQNIFEDDVIYNGIDLMNELFVLWEQKSNRKIIW